MKKNYLSMLVAMIVVTSCQMKTKTIPFDPVSAKAEVTKTLDSIDTALKAKDAKTFLSFYTEDGLFCGTDPTELWDKAGFTKAITAMLADTTMSSDIKDTKKEILIDKGGNSANVLRQFTTNWSKPIMLRGTMHLIKADNKWLVDFSSMALIPENKDIPKLTAAVGK
jgi:ketosteroid isomerase-like protein